MKTKTHHFNREQLSKMDPQKLNNLLAMATEITGTAVVRRKDGTIKYDDETLAGSYGE